jgi:hypothetical protein
MGIIHVTVFWVMTLSSVGVGHQEWYPTISLHGVNPEDHNLNLQHCGNIRSYTNVEYISAKPTESFMQVNLCLIHLQFSSLNQVVSSPQLLDFTLECTIMKIHCG